MNNPHRAVDVGETPFTWGKQKQFPFMYTFLTPTTDKQADPGLAIASNSRMLKHIRLDPDYAYRMLWVKYVAFEKDGTRYIPFDLNRTVFELPGDPAALAGDVLTNHLFISLTVLSSDSRTILGGKNLQPWRSDNDPLLENDLVPMNAGAGQGYLNGYGEVRTPYLCPKDGVLQFRLYNNHDATLYVNALIFGLKVRV